LPTLLLVIERDDDGARAVRLELDGKAGATPVDTGPLEMLPGKHTLRFTLEGYTPVERAVELAKGEKNHVVRVRFVRELPKSAAPPVPPPRAPELSRPVPLGTYLAAAGAIAAFTTSGILLASALSSRDAAPETCAPVCRDGEREAIDQRLLAADLAAGAGLLLGGVAVYTFVTRPTVVVGRAPGTAPGERAFFGASLRGRF
jgi:hypothetical protein